MVIRFKTDSGLTARYIGRFSAARRAHFHRSLLGAPRRRQAQNGRRPFGAQMPAPRRRRRRAIISRPLCYHAAGIVGH